MRGRGPRQERVTLQAKKATHVLSIYPAVRHGPVGHPETMKIAVLAHLSGIDRGTAASHRYSPTERHTTKSSKQWRSLRPMEA